LTNIKGISRAVCMHRILLKDDAKPVREPQPKLKVVTKEILKLVHQGIIYQIYDSQWVSPIHMVPKNTSLTTNKHNELVPARVQNDYKM